MCAVACSGSVNVSISLVETNALDLSTPQDTLSISIPRAITSGTGADQCDLMWHDERTLSNGATESLDLNGGTLTGAFGSITLDKLKGIYVANYSTENSLKIGGATANAVTLFDSTTDILTLPPASATNKPSRFFMEAPAAAGIDVSTNVALLMARGTTTTNSVTYRIAIWGED